MYIYLRYFHWRELLQYKHKKISWKNVCLSPNWGMKALLPWQTGFLGKLRQLALLFPAWNVLIRYLCWLLEPWSQLTKRNRLQNECIDRASFSSTSLMQHIKNESTYSRVDSKSSMTSEIMDKEDVKVVEDWPAALTDTAIRGQWFEAVLKYFHCGSKREKKRHIFLAFHALWSKKLDWLSSQ